MDVTIRQVAKVIAKSRNGCASLDRTPELVAGDDSGSLENGTSDSGENAVGAGGDDTGA